MSDEIAVESYWPGSDFESRAYAPPGTICSANSFDVWLVPETTADHSLLGTAMVNETSAAGAPVVFVNVTVKSREDPGVKVCGPACVLAVAAGAKLSGVTSYLAATIFAWTSWSVAFDGNVPAAVIAPS